MNNPSIDQTINLLKIVHHDQFDWTGEEYWKHPVEVMNRLLPCASDEDRLVALLHDTVEDCEVAMGRLLGLDPADVTFEVRVQFLRDRGYSEYVVRGVMLDSHIDGMFYNHATDSLTPGTYMDYIRNLIDSGHLGAMLTKLADNEHNTDPARIERLPPEQKAKIVEMANNRYRRSMNALRRALVEMGIITEAADGAPDRTRAEIDMPNDDSPKPFRAMLDGLTEEEWADIRRLAMEDEAPCVKCGGVILAGGCPGRHADCPQWRKPTKDKPAP